MKISITFETQEEEDKETIERMLKVDEYHFALQEIANEVFRPARKHGYSDKKIQDILASSEEGVYEELISLLEEKFYEILKDNNIDL